MSLATWKEEFYPVDAGACPRDQALEHSILKWTGLLPENLEKHGVRKRASYIEDSEEKDWLSIDANSCALCKHYYISTYGCSHEVNTCPIVRVTGTTCDKQYAKFIIGDQVTPMLDLLRQVKEALDAT